MTQTVSDFQHEVIALANQDGRLIYADPMGARKTATTLLWLAQRNDAHRIIVVAPTQQVAKQWVEQAEVWYPEAAVFSGLGTGVKRGVALHKASLITAQAHVYVTTYASMKRDEANLLDLFDTYVFDEGHALKGRTTQVAKCAYKLSGGKRRTPSNILCVTGTPVLNAPQELWFYLHLLYRKDFRSFWGWVHEHFIVSEKLFKGHSRAVKIIGDYLPGHEEIVRNQLAGVMIQRDEHELFPDAVWVQPPEFFEVEVDLSEEERKLYDQMVDHSWANFPHKTITAGNGLAVSTRLRQFTSDWGTLDAQVEEGAKVRRTLDLVRLLTKLTGPVVVFVEFRETGHRLARLLWKDGIRALNYDGAQRAAENESALAQFKEGMVDVIIGTYGSMREGVDGLQHRCHQMVLLDLLWVPGLNDQAIGRLRRDGQKHRVKVWRVYAKDTTDGVVLQANLRKVNVWRVIKGQPLMDVVYGRSLDVKVAP